MTCSPAQLAANRANSMKSTGPRTTEGKSRSRANALKHGLCASAVVPESLELIQERASEWFHPLKPQNEYHAWLVDKITIYSLRIDRGERMERRLRDRKSLRAELAWDEERKLEVEALGARLPSRPAESVAALRRTTVGCDWLIGRWTMLEKVAAGGPWTPEQARLAFDLLATPPEFRDRRQPGDLDPESDDSRPAAVAARERARLLEHRATIAELDEVDRALTEADLFDESHPELKRLRRQEATLHNRLRWCLAELRHISIHFKPNPELIPRWVADLNPPLDEPTPEPEAAEPTPEPKAAEPKAAPAPAAKARRPEAPKPDRFPHPPFDLEPHEYPPLGEPVDLQKILVAREVKRLKRAESRRDAKRRKLERLRA